MGILEKIQKPLRAMLCIIARFKCIQRCHKWTVDLRIFFRCDKLVADWSIPSMIKDIIKSLLLLGI